MHRLRVAVVGGGIGGITAARTLTEKGHDVVVFEKEDRLGGKCWSLRFNGQSYEMGACSVSPEFRTVLRYARTLGARVKRRFPFHVMRPDGTWQSFRKEYWPLEKTPTILAQMARYVYHAARFDLLYSRPATYVNLPDEYQQDFMSFCKANGMEDIAPWMELPITSFGYGDLRSIRTWYVLDYMNVINFMGFATLLMMLGQSPVHKFHQGFGEMVQRMALGLNVRIGRPVTRIERTGHEVRITVQGAEEPEVFDKVVIALPLPDIAECLDTTPDEREILDQVQSNRYLIVAAVLEGMPHDNYLLRFNANQENFGHVALIERNLHGEAADLSVCYIPIIDLERSTEEVLADLSVDLQKLGIRIKRIVTTKEWNYFSHFTNGKVYERLQAMQGDNDTYFVGGLTKFELAERVAREAEANMDRYFEGQRPREMFTTLKNVLWFYLRSVGPYA